jgi:hypothetical protein
MLMRYTHLRAETVGMRLDAAENGQRSFIKIADRKVVPDVAVASAMLERGSARVAAIERSDVSRRCINGVKYRATVDELMNDRFGISTTRADEALIEIGVKNRISPDEFVEVLREIYDLEELS